jgi:hypothetical protein
MHQGRSDRLKNQLEIAAVGTVAALPSTAVRLEVLGGSWAIATVDVIPRVRRRTASTRAGGSSWATMARPMAMMVATMPSIRSAVCSWAGLLAATTPPRPLPPGGNLFGPPAVDGRTSQGGLKAGRGKQYHAPCFHLDSGTSFEYIIHIID